MKEYGERRDRAIRLSGICPSRHVEDMSEIGHIPANPDQAYWINIARKGINHLQVQHRIVACMKNGGWSNRRGGREFVDRMSRLLSANHVDIP
jgi:hypothetical protein